jgi:hypothetical protein
LVETDKFVVLLQSITNEIGLDRGNEVEVEVGINSQVEDFLDTIPNLVNVDISRVGLDQKSEINHSTYCLLICKRAGIQRQNTLMLIKAM